VNVMPHWMLISDGLIQAGSELSLHPVLLPWQEEMIKRKRAWFSCKDKVPLEWYAAIVDAPPAVLLATQCGDIPVDTKQCWVASPYSSQLGRDTVRVMSEGSVPWREEDARWLCDMLNPLLGEEKMHLLNIGAALLLACCEPMAVRPESFAMVAGKVLPNHHPEGADGGRLMRLISEIQMSLHGIYADHRAGKADIHGLWFWGGSLWPAKRPETMPAVATRNPFLQAVVEGKDAKMMMTEAERIDELVKQGTSLPEKIVLAGEGNAVLLTKALLPRLGKAGWIPKSARDEPELLSELRRFI